MRKKSPIHLDGTQFCPIYNSKNSIDEKELNELGFDEQHDFVINRELGVLAVKLYIYNCRFHEEHNSHGVRRTLSVRFVDTTSRMEVASQAFPLKMNKGEAYRIQCLQFPAAEMRLAHGHTYQLSVWDDLTGEMLDEQILHAYSEDELGCPAGWYEVTDGGLRPEWEEFAVYRSIKTEPVKEVYARFDLTHKFGRKLPKILPELEVRIYHPGGYQIDVRYIEPKYIEYDHDTVKVEMPFLTRVSYGGPFYAEVLCMQYPLAGFVFSTTGPEVKGPWGGKCLDAMDEYSLTEVEERLAELQKEADEANHDPEADDFEAALDRFIASETETFEDLDPFDIDDDDHDDDQEVDLPSDEPAPEVDDDAEEGKSIVDSLSHLTGLKSVKEKLARYEKVVLFNKMRADHGLPVDAPPLHAMFLGSPGTGKTTVAKRMGAMLRRAGVLSKGHVVVRERATLLGQNYASESENTLKAIEAAQGGILFIDEAYQLFQPDDPRDPGKFVIESLLTTLADESHRDWMLILAGYADKMRPMFDMNPGFKSRIPESNIYTFDDFSEAELMEIAERYLERRMFTLSAEARQALERRLKEDCKRRDSTFGNARHVINMIQTDILPAMAVRVVDSQSADEGHLSEIQAADIPAASQAQAANGRPRIGFC